MQLIVRDSYEEMSTTAAELIAAHIHAKPEATVVVAVGSTPTRCYAELTRLRQQGMLDVSKIRPFQLDEYLVPADDSRSLYRWVKRDFLHPLGIAEERLVRLRADTGDLVLACQEYDKAVQEAGGFDIAILGLGPNGHLGFNEPPANPNSPTHALDLTEASIKSNAPYWGGETRVPRQAVTCGMANLLAARHVFLLVSGGHKREILRRTVEGLVTPDVPASYLQGHADVTVLADREAWP